MVNGIGLGQTQILRSAEHARRQLLSAKNRQLVLATAWADCHPPESIDPYQLEIAGGDRPIQPGGDGTPQVADFCLAEFGTSLGLSIPGTQFFLADALDLRHRLPRIWGRICRNEIDGFYGQLIARETRHLSLHQALLVDRAVAAEIGRLAWSRVRRHVRAKIIEVDAERIKHLAELAAGETGVWVCDSDDDGIKTMVAKAEAADLIWFDAMVDRIADILGRRGDRRRKSARRAAALGVLGNPLRAIRLIAEDDSPSLFDPDPDTGSMMAPPADLESDGTDTTDHHHEANGSGCAGVDGSFEDRCENGAAADDDADRHEPAAADDSSGDGYPAPAGPACDHPNADLGDEPSDDQAGDDQATNDQAADDQVLDDHGADDDCTAGDESTGGRRARAASCAGPVGDATGFTRIEEPVRFPRIDRDQHLAQAAIRAVSELDPASFLPKATLYVHIALETLQAGLGVARVEDVGPIVSSQVAAWLTDCQITVKPVIDLNADQIPIDSYEVPRAMRERIFLRQPGSMFPYSGAVGRHLDLDHAIPFRRGFPAQTGDDTVNPAARREHRPLTHGLWKRRMPEPGTVVFRAPHGTVILVNQTGSHDLGRGEFAHHIWHAAAPEPATI